MATITWEKDEEDLEYTERYHGYLDLFEDGRKALICAIVKDHELTSVLDYVNVPLLVDEVQQIINFMKEIDG